MEYDSLMTAAALRFIATAPGAPVTPMIRLGRRRLAPFRIPLPSCTIEISRASCAVATPPGTTAGRSRENGFVSARGAHRHARIARPRRDRHEDESTKPLATPL